MTTNLALHCNLIIQNALDFWKQGTHDFDYKNREYHKVDVYFTQYGNKSKESIPMIYADFCINLKYITIHLETVKVFDNDLSDYNFNLN